MYGSFHLSINTALLNVRTSGALTLFLLLSSFPSVSALPSFDLDFCFILLYFTLSYLVASSRSLFFSNETGREWIKTVGKVGRNWEEESEGNSNHSMLYKNRISFR